MSYRRQPNTIPSPVPTEYDRLHDFAAWEADHPGQPAPGAWLNDEFNRLERTTDELLDRVALIQRDDGNLQNGIVTIESVEANFLDDLMAEAGIDTAAVVAAAASAQADSAAAAQSASDAQAAASDAQDALAGVTAALTVLDTYAAPTNLPVSGGETHLDYLDAQVDIDAVELVKNGALLFSPQDYTISAITGGVRFALVSAAINTDKFWVRNQRVYRPTDVGLEINAVSGRVTALEAVNAGARLSALESADTALDGRVDALEAFDAGTRLSALESADAAMDARVDALEAIDADTRLDALEAAGVATTLPAGTITTKTVGSGGDYATLTAAFAALRSVRVPNSSVLILSLTGDITETAGVVWSHPDSARIVLDLNGADRTITLPAADWPLVSAYNTGLGASLYAGVWLPPGQVLNYKSAANTLTLALPASLPTVTPKRTFAVLSGTIRQWDTADSTNRPLTLKATSAGATVATPLYCSGADFGGATLSASGYGLKFRYDAAAIASSDQIVTCVNCTGELEVSRVVGGGSPANLIVVGYLCRNLRVSGSVRGATLVGCVGARLYLTQDISPLNGSAFQIQGGDVSIEFDSGLQLAKTTFTTAPFDISGGARVRMTGAATIDNGSTALASAIVYASEGSDLYMKGLTFSNPPSSGSKYVVYLVDGSTARCTGVVYGGTFASNKSNASTSWSSTTGQFLSN